MKENQIFEELKNRSIFNTFEKELFENNGFHERRHGTEYFKEYIQDNYRYAIIVKKRYRDFVLIISKVIVELPKDAKPGLHKVNRYFLGYFNTASTLMNDFNEFLADNRSSKQIRFYGTTFPEII